MLNELSSEWMQFQQMLIDADVMLKKYKVNCQHDIFPIFLFSTFSKINSPTNIYCDRYEVH